jgi:uncharacterized membrane protein (DUF373 family)
VQKGLLTGPSLHNLHRNHNSSKMRANNQLEVIMEKTLLPLLRQIIEKLRNPIFLFAISYGLVIVAISVQNSNKIKELAPLLLIVLILGLIGSIFLEIFTRPKSHEALADSNSLIPHWTGSCIGNRAATVKEFSRINVKTNKIKLLAISSLTTTLNSKIQLTFPSLLQTEIKCLLLSTEADESIVARVKENPVGLKDHINSGTSLLQTTKKRINLPNFHLRTYTEMPVFRILIIDDYAYFSYYPRNKTADDVPVMVVERQKGWIYDAIEKYVDSIWKDKNRSNNVFKGMKFEWRANIWN